MSASQVLSGAKDPLRTNAADPSVLSRLRTWLAVGVAAGLPQIASACPVCFGGPGAGGQGMNAAIWFLIAVIGFVQVCFAGLFFTFWRRARELRRKRESFQIIDGGVR